jgi:predicted 3-demethylubiquinone-9 3-methyltransferase (glyoxalase superfamily)
MEFVMANNFPCLWFKSEAEEALNYYVSIIPNSQIQQVTRVNEAGPFPKGAVISVTAMLDGQLVLALNGNPQFLFSLATSLVTLCETQAELDERWEKLSAGGQTMQCGWLWRCLAGDAEGAAGIFVGRPEGDRPRHGCDDADDQNGYRGAAKGL